MLSVEKLISIPNTEIYIITAIERMIIDWNFLNHSFKMRMHIPAKKPVNNENNTTPGH
jgi:hypothetical protein